MRPDGEGETGQAPNDAGSAVVEFIFLGLILLVPVVYLVITVGRIQAASFAVVGAADAAAKVYAAAPDAVVGEQQAADAAELALSDFGLQADGMLMDISCSETCLAPGSTVTVSVRYEVPLPGLPRADGSPVAVDSESTQVVERNG
ncbi:MULTISPECIES: hypothetical protein [unclassified Arthrobacter]|uniref:hypothetical protein n=1 Tax=unclassified Arthrobacter TaxID=235627 RepID=UPI002105CDD5|nr:MULTISPECIES: hypothetical protein [unclassified Arthrobacter]MCQ1945370.1 hypothetical protein [Arthrobacter sp. zg-Y1116]MCQ1994969.1 hypothetical protein [Arthrobacter sp. zg-Y1171]UWX80976.1 hypothetical protein N2L00_11205 [Arthrobacter sp. zg-Y1171]